MLRRAAIEVRDVAPKVAEEAIEVGRVESVNAAEASRLHFSGALVRGFYTTLRTEGDSTVGRVLNKRREQARAQEEGRLAGDKLPPTSERGSIIPWVLAHIGGSFSLFLNRRGKARKVRAGATNAAERTATSQSAEKQIRRIAFVIARSIGKKGYPGKHFFQRGTDAMVRATPSIMERKIRDFISAQGATS